jgi:hypothetical protein
MDDHARIEPMNLVKAFGATVNRLPDKTALYWGDAKFSYAD